MFDFWLLRDRKGDCAGWAAPQAAAGGPGSSPAPEQRCLAALCLPNAPREASYAVGVQ